MTLAMLWVAAACTLGACAAPSPPHPIAIHEHWHNYPVGSTFSDGTALGPWIARFNGLGSISIVRDPRLGPMLQLVPMAATTPSQTHAALVTSASSFGDFTASVQMLTLRQLRTPTPNGWEAGWVLWHYTDDAHFYYFILNQTGWELGKEDATAPLGRRFLITGSAPMLALGKSNTIGIAQHGSTISITIDARPIVQYTDYEHPYPVGELGLYCEDAAVRFGAVSVLIPNLSHQR